MTEEQEKYQEYVGSEFELCVCVCVFVCGIYFVIVMFCDYTVLPSTLVLVLNTLRILVCCC